MCCPDESTHIHVLKIVPLLCLEDSYRSLPLPLLSSEGQATQQILPHQFQILALTIEEARSSLLFRDSKLSATKP